jgi:RNA polymerase sigma-70 factor (ECF subfamily)
VLAAGKKGASGSRDALAALCERYWYPIYAQVRRMRYDPDTAQDLTQGFFAHLLETRALKVATPERGHFRAFLKVSLRHYLSNERNRVQAQKRGGGKPHVSLDLSDAEYRYRREPAHGETAEVQFEKSWARTILARALDRVRAEANSSPGARDRFRRLEPFLSGSSPTTGTYRRIAAELKMSESAVKVAVHRLRARFGEALRAEIAETLDDADKVDEEIRYLLSILEPGTREL